MFRRILSSLTVMLFAFCMNAGAQVLQVSESKIEGYKPVSAFKQIMTSSLKIENDEKWVGYWDGQFDDKLSSLGGRVPNFDVAMKYEKGSPVIAGKTIEGIRFTFPDHTIIKNVKVWLSTTLPESADKADIICQSVTDITSMKNEADPYNEVRFSTPYVCPADKDLYIGYSFEQTAGTASAVYPIVIDKDVFKEKGTLMAKLSDASGKGNWVDYFNAQKNYGVAAIQVLMKGNFSDNQAGFVDNLGSFITVSNQIDVPVIMHNIGVNDIANFTFEGDVNGTKTVCNIVPTAPVKGLGSIYRFMAKVNVPATAGRYDFNIKITKINGVDVENNMTASGNVTIPSKQGNHKIFVENYTDMASAECPIGFIGTEKMKKVYRDDVIISTIHVDDALAPADRGFEHTSDKLPYIPGANLDRTVMDVDPYFGATQGTKFGIGENIDMLKKVAIAPADINVSCNLKGYILTVKSDVTFYYTGDASNYSVAYFVTEDNKADPTWTQANGFTQYADLGGLTEQEPLFEPWVNGKEVRDDVIYNDVLIGSRGFKNGVDGSIPEKVVDGVANSHTVEFDLSNYTLIQDFNNLRVIAVLINRENGRVVNANSFKMKKDEPEPEFEMKEGESWIGYWDGNASGALNGIGVGQVLVAYDVAIKYPAGSPEIAGKTIEGIKFAFRDINEIRDVKVFMSTELPEQIHHANIICQDVAKITSINDLKKPFNEVRFEKPYVCPADKDLYIGYSFEVGQNADPKYGKFPVVISQQVNNTNAIWMHAYNAASPGTWANYSTIQGTHCGATIQALVSDTAAGIENIETSGDAVEVARYTMDGTRIAAPQKGVNIVKYSDGSVRKIVVR